MNAQESSMGLYYTLLNHCPLLLLKRMLQRLCLNKNLILNHGLFLWDGALEAELWGESSRRFSEIPDTTSTSGKAISIFTSPGVHVSCHGSFSNTN